MKNLLLLFGFLLITLSISAQCESNSIYIPNAITADGDNVNDAWKVETNCDFDECDIRIFNNWGQCVWKSTNIEEYWNGEVHDGNHYSQTNIYKYVVTLRKQGIPPLQKYGLITVVR